MSPAEREVICAAYAYEKEFGWLADALEEEELHNSARFNLIQAVRQLHFEEREDLLPPQERTCP